MICSNCKKELQAGVLFCPVCGTRVTEQQSEVTAPEEATVNSEEQTTEAAEQAAEATVNSEEQTTEAAEQEEPQEEAKAPEVKKKPYVKIAVGAAVLIVLVVIAANVKVLANIAMKLVNSPAEYYQYVEGKYLKEWADMLTGSYDESIEQAKKIFSQSAEGQIKITLGEKGKKIIKELSGISVSKINDATITLDSNMTEKVMEFGLGIKLNEDSLLSTRAQVDIDEKIGYVAVPELNPDIIGYAFDEYEGYDEFVENYRNLKDIYAAYPDKQQLDSIIAKYMEIILNGVVNVTEEKTVLKAEGISQKCTMLTIEMDADEMMDIVEAVLTEAEQDKELEKIIIDFVDALYMEELSGEKAVVEFHKSITHFLDEEMEDYRNDTDAELVMQVYVDKEGQIRGRSITMKDSTGSRNEEMVIDLYMPQDGKQFGYEAIVTRNTRYSDGEKDKEVLFTLKGSGENRRDKLTGELALKVKGVKMLDLLLDEYDYGELKKGRMNGSMTINPSSAMMKALESELPREAASFLDNLSMSLSNLALKLDFSTGKDSVAYTLAFLYKEDLLAELELSSKQGGVKKISYPDSKSVTMAESETDLLEWFTDIDWDEYIDMLDDTAMPSELVDMLEGAIDLIDLFGGDLND